MATLKIGHILGESVAKGYEGEIDVQAWSWAVGHAEEPDQQPAIGDLVITKSLDKASPELVMLACSGRVIPEAVLTVPRGGRWADLVMLRIRLNEVKVRSVAFAGVQDDAPGESISLSFAEFAMEYIEQIEERQGATTFTSWRNADEMAAPPETQEETW